ncbi:hypothetical protein K492DRAFT_177036 [Lichtheimia hyalospora FSU 10163]|nr:hypothetical protein K492DRAFT_177036 [Lichtheimia hyalospora FSU 10163]
MATTTAPDIHNVIHVLQQDIENLNHDKMMLQKEKDDESDRLNAEVAYLRQRIEDIQHENNSISKAQSRLETQLYAQEQDNTKLRKELNQLTKAKKDAEKKLTAELEEFENDRARWQQREADLYNQIRTLHATQGEPRTPRTPRRRSVTATTMSNTTTMSPFTNYPLGDIGEDNEAQEQESPSSPNGLVVQAPPKLAAIDASYAREAKIAQRTIKAQDKLIAELKNDIEKQNALIEEQRSDAKQQSLRMEHLDHEIASIKQVNRSLMEDNESYQILLHEKTISGEFIMNPIMQVEEKRRSMKASTSTGSNGLNLAAELNLASVGTSDWEAQQKASETDQTISKLSEENKMLQDTNRALQLYMNKILMKIINDKQLVDVLSIDQPKPTPVTTTTSSRLAEQAKQQKKSTPAAPTPGPGPAPSRTLSSSLLGKATSGRQQRRRTISYWSGGGNKGPTPPAAALVNDNSKKSGTTESPTRSNDSDHTSSTPTSPTTATGSRRHSTHAGNGGWAKALRRMSGIGWSSSSSTTQGGKSDDSNNDTSSTSDTSSATSDNNNNNARPNGDVPSPKLAAPSMSRSTSTTSSSLRRSSELATLQEE